jgi:hypothetical protein
MVCILYITSSVFETRCPLTERNQTCYCARMEIQDVPDSFLGSFCTETAGCTYYVSYMKQGELRPRAIPSLIVGDLES